MKASTVLFAVVCAVALPTLFAQQYPGCTSDAQCKVTGDSVRCAGCRKPRMASRWGLRRALVGQVGRMSQ